jgi:isoleucyl-tRNA synthetase
MANRYKEFKHLNLPAIEKEVLQRWERENAFKKSIEVREGAEPFVFYEGPPSANGMPGIHHVISRTLKDLVCRYKTMQGYKVQRKGGWDTHGLPIELGVEKELGITKEDIGKKISVAEYNQKCREAVLRYKDKWDDLTTKMGYWVDLEHPYVTFTNEYIETLWWCLKELYNKGLLYKSVSIQPYSPAAGTGLSSHELNQPGTYRNVKDTSAVAMFKYKAPQPPKGGSADAQPSLNENADNRGSSLGVDMPHKQTPPWEGLGEAEVFFLAWTTTPWTLPSNLGLTVGPNIDYVLIKTFNPYTHLPVNVVLAKSLVNRYFKPEGENGDFEGYSAEQKLLPWKILTEFKGKELEGLEYERLLPYEANSLEAIRAITPDAQPFRVLLGDFVTTEDGTGIVHTAPAFGADDYRVGKKYNIGILTLVDREGKFVDGLGEFSRRFIKDYKNEANYVDVNVDISVKLKKENRAFKVEKYEHSYPHCWRTDKPVVYYPLDAWFIKTTAKRDRMVELNKTINWKPESTGTGRFGNWLENMVDWNLSRSRYWGTPLPIWRTEDGSEEKCIGSIEELNAEIKKASQVLGGDVNTHYLHDGILDLHKPYVDEVILVSESGKPMHREPDLIDVWFDSGAMPYAQWHFPFENKEIFKENFPADFIAEGVDQTRGWFYTLHALGVMLFDSVAYKTCVSNGLVLDKNGNKMSKRLGNVVDPFQTIEQFGADATRWYLITNASPWDNLKFDLEGIKEVQRKFFGTLYNTYQFFALYANVDGFSFKEAYIPLEERPEIDKWILSSLQTLIKKVAAAFNDYEPTQAGRLVEDFVDEHLSNWYVRLCRRRFWKGEYEQDKIAAYQTLYECLETVVRLMAPISPFFSDELFINLNAVTKKHQEASVHHILFPTPKEEYIDVLLEERMGLAQDASSLILSLRKKANIKVRQPLQKALIPVLNPLMEQQLHKVEDLIKAEVNIKDLKYLSDTEGFIKKKIKPNFGALGKKLGLLMKGVNTALSNFSQHEISLFEKEGRYSIPVGNDEYVELALSEVEISSEDIPGWTVASKGPLTVALDINITPELIQEGDAREFVNRIQKIRKDSGFDVTDRIEVKVAANNGISSSLAKYNDYICAEILADKLELTSQIDEGTEIEVNDNPLKVIVLKKG